MKNENFDMAGIKCDNVHCGYRDDSVLSKDYKDYVDKPCPKCGSNLLTQKDYKSFLIIQTISNHPWILFLNKIGTFLGFKTKKFDVEMNGSGKVSFKEDKTPTDPPKK